jgi:L-methionine (R)-S-oxide reductase
MKIDLKSVATRIRDILTDDKPRDERARRIAEEIRSLGSYRWAGLYDVTASEVRIVAFSGPSAPAYPVFSREKGLTGEMLRRNQTIISGDVGSDPNYLTAFSSTQSEMIVPVRSHDGAIVGSIDVESEAFNAFDDEQREAVEAISRIIEPLFWKRGH